MANLKVAKPTRQDFDICHRFNSVMEALTDNRMYRCADEADWQEWDEDDEDVKVLSEIRDGYCQWADKDKEDLDNDDHQQILWRYVKWFFNNHPSAFRRVLMCAEIAMDNAFDNSDEVRTIEWNQRCSEALDMWDEKHKEGEDMDKQPIVLTLEMDWGEYNTVLCFMDNSAGSVSISNYTEEKFSVIHGLYVDERYMRTGIATRLLDEADKHADFPIMIWVREDAPEWLCSFYEKRGYQVYLQNNE